MEPIIGSETANPALFMANSVINMTDQIHRNGLPLIFDYDVNDSHTPHNCTERPGGRIWEYWQTALPYQVLFLVGVLQANGSAVSQR